MVMIEKRYAFLFWQMNPVAGHQQHTRPAFSKRISIITATCYTCIEGIPPFSLSLSLFLVRESAEVSAESFFKDSLTLFSFCCCCCCLFPKCLFCGKCVASLTAWWAPRAPSAPHRNGALRCSLRCVVVLFFLFRLLFFPLPASFCASLRCLPASFSLLCL